MRMLSFNESNPALAPLAPFVLRLATGLVFFMHGWQKLTGGVDGVAGFLGSLGFPMASVFAVLLIAAEVVGGAFLILGLWTGIVARVLALVALIAWITVHLSKGFFVGQGGYEFIMLIFAACVALAITGPGRWSLGRMMRRSQAA
jgi:putative oxidoreductase